MKIKTLENTSLTDLTTAFNAGFEGYFVKLHLTDEQMQQRITTESIDLSLSVGMFDEGRIVGFILTGLDTINGILTANNAGTGVITSYRSRGITLKLYDYLLPLLKERGVEKCVLEVITDNEIAIHLYEKVGYEKERKLDAFKSDTHLSDDTNIDYRTAEELNPEWMKFCDVHPAWQYSLTAINKTHDKKVIEILDRDGVIAAAVVKPSNGRVLFFGVEREHRSKGLGTALFQIMGKLSEVPLSVINLDSSASGIITFLEKTGFTHFLSQYEMSMDIK